MAFITIKNICCVKTLLRKQKDKPDWKNIFAKQISDKVLVPKIYKEFSKLKNRKTDNPIKSGQKFRTDISPKKWKIAYEKMINIKCHGKGKLKQ